MLTILLCCLLQAPPPPVTVVFETTMGAIVIEVDVAKAPLTSANFLRYVDEGWYNEGRFHRAVRPETETNTTHPIQVIEASRRRTARGEGPACPPLGPATPVVSSSPASRWIYAGTRRACRARRAPE